MADGCGLGRSNWMKKNGYTVHQSNHSRGVWVKGSSVVEDWMNKVHDAGAERAFRNIRYKSTLSAGFTRVSKNETQQAAKESLASALKKHIHQADYINNYTDNSAASFTFALIHHIQQYFP